MIRVITADDHALIRQGIIRIIEKTPDIRVVGEAGDGAELLREIGRTACDVVVVDVTMPGMDAIELVGRIRADHPSLPILVLSMHPEDAHAVRLLRAGADGYVTKAAALGDLAAAIRRVFGGGKYISPALAEDLVMRLGGGRIPLPHEALSEREFQVLCRIAGGETVSAISRELGLSVKTVSTYRTRVLEKMNMHNNAQLTYYAIQNRLV